MSDPTPAPKVLLFTDTRTGHFFAMEVPHTSPWHELLPDHQECEIRFAQPEQPPQP